MNILFLFPFYCVSRRTLISMVFVNFSTPSWTAMHPKSFHVIYFYHFSSLPLRNHKFKRRYSIKWLPWAVMRPVHLSHHTPKVRNHLISSTNFRNIFYIYFLLDFFSSLHAFVTHFIWSWKALFLCFFFLFCFLVMPVNIRQTIFHISKLIFVVEIFAVSFDIFHFTWFTKRTEIP